MQLLDTHIVLSQAIRHLHSQCRVPLALEARLGGGGLEDEQRKTGASGLTHYRPLWWPLSRSPLLVLKR